MARDPNISRDDDYPDEDELDLKEENEEEEDLDEPRSHRSIRRSRKTASGYLDD
jgi:hypothetical protein